MKQLTCTDDKVVYFDYDDSVPGQVRTFQCSFLTGELITLVENSLQEGSSNAVYSHFRLFDKVELGEGNIAVLYTANTKHYDAELDYIRGYEAIFMLRS